MQFEKVEDLELWERADEFWVGVDEHPASWPCIRRHRKLHEQLSDAADSILSNIAEGFEQPTDRAFAKYLYTAKASTAESGPASNWVVAGVTFRRRNSPRTMTLGDEIARIANGLIKYLLASDRRDRALGRKATPPARADTRKMQMTRNMTGDDDDCRRLTSTQ